MQSSWLLLIVTVLVSLGASIFLWRVLLSNRKEIFSREKVKQRWQERWQGRPKWQLAVIIIMTPVAIWIGWITAPHIPQPWGRVLTSVILILLTLRLAKTLRERE